MADSRERLPHLFSRQQPVALARKPGGGGAKRAAPVRGDPQGHAQRLLTEFDSALEPWLQASNATEVSSTADGAVVELIFVSDLRVDLDGLEAFGCELLKATEDASGTRVLLFVPAAKYANFKKRFLDYAGNARTATGKRRNQPFIDALDAIRASALAEYWSGPLESLPVGDDPAWWEIWVVKSRSAAFEAAAQSGRLRLSEFEPLVFSERAVFLAYGTPDSVYRTILATAAVAELRPYFGLAGMVESKLSEFQTEIADELAGRRVGPTDELPYVTILDQGINSGHRLLAGILDPADVLALNDWPSVGTEQHGNGMAGLAVFGDQLRHSMLHKGSVPVSARLESVRILRTEAANPPGTYGAVTRQGAALAVANAPGRKRLFCMAVTEDYAAPYPSAWSAAVDQICFGDAASKASEKNLFFVCSGNVRPVLVSGYTSRNEQESCASPAQSWNALTIGAMTELTQIAPGGKAGSAALAPADDLCPSSRTSLMWNDAAGNWPIKPDLVMEGGNSAQYPGDPVAEAFGDQGELGQLSLAMDRAKGKLFQVFGETSGATALAANLAAQVWAASPDRWPETVRALMVHSASHTAAMQRRFPGDAKGDIRRRMRAFGYGRPDEELAISSARSHAVVIHEGEIQPFRPNGNKAVINQAVLFDLPIPSAALLDRFSDENFTLRVTLSYFIEPNPGGRSYRGNYRYASHHLRFDVQKVGESIQTFRERIAKDAAQEDSDVDALDMQAASGPDDWFVGPQTRNLSTVQSDWVRESGATLATRREIAVYPVTGWWKTRFKLGNADRRTRFSLVVSLAADNTDIDIYTPIQTLISTPIEIS
jgi:hypothetical protein